MRLRTILTTAGVSAALVAGGIAGPAYAVDPVTVQPVISLSSYAATVPALTPTLQLGINSTALDNARVKVWLVTNGIPVEQYSAGYPDAAGNLSIDLYSKLASSKALYAGTYQFFFTTDATTDYFSDPTPDVNYLAAQSQFFTLTVTKIQSSITGWKVVNKKARHGKNIAISGANLHGVGPETKIVLQYRKKGAKKWKTSVSNETYSFTPLEVPIKKDSFNSFTSKEGIAKRGTYQVRILIKESPYVTGAVTKQSTLRWY